MAEENGGILKAIEDFSANVSPLDFYVVFQHWDLFLQGLVNTVSLVVLSLVIGGALSIPLAIARANRKPVFNQVIWAYVYVFRGTPLLVQTYLIYYGLGQFEVVRDSVLWPFLREAFLTWLKDSNFTAKGAQKQALSTLTEAAVNKARA